MHAPGDQQTPRRGERPKKDPSVRTCFVISPIGAEDSPIRKHMDDVFHCIVEPACKRAGYDVYRGDHKSRPGRITQHIVDSILDDDLIICVITGANPNVFYELAIAESAGRPIVVLKLKGEAIPFDVKDVRVIEYDMDPRRIYEEVFVDQILEAIGALENEGLDKSVVPFAPRLSPLGSDSLDMRIARQYGELSSTEVLKIAQAAKRKLDICGMTLKGWSLNEPLCNLIKTRSQQGLATRLLIMHPENTALQQMIDSDNAAELERVKQAIHESFAAWQKMAAECKMVSARLVSRGIIYQQAVISDHEMIWAPHLFRFGTSETPAIRVMPIYTGEDGDGEPAMRIERPHTYQRAHLLQALSAEFEYLWRRNGGAPG